MAGLPGIQEGCVPTRGFSFPPHPSACQANEASPLITLEGKAWLVYSPKTQSHHFSSKQVVLAIFFESHSLSCTFNLWLWRRSIRQEMPPSRTALEQPTGPHSPLPKHIAGEQAPPEKYVMDTDLTAQTLPSPSPPTPDPTPVLMLNNSLLT